MSAMQVENGGGSGLLVAGGARIDVAGGKGLAGAAGPALFDSSIAPVTVDEVRRNLARERAYKEKKTTRAREREIGRVSNEGKAARAKRKKKKLAALEGRCRERKGATSSFRPRKSFSPASFSPSLEPHSSVHSF